MESKILQKPIWMILAQELKGKKLWLNNIHLLHDCIEYKDLIHVGICVWLDCGVFWTNHIANLSGKHFIHINQNSGIFTVFISFRISPGYATIVLSTITNSRSSSVLISLAHIVYWELHLNHFGLSRNKLYLKFCLHTKNFVCQFLSFVSNVGIGIGLIRIMVWFFSFMVLPVY